MFKIIISYSWESEKEEAGCFKTEEEAYKEMCMLAAKEAYGQNNEFEEGKPCMVNFDAFEKTVDLYYGSDGEWCHYRIKKIC